MSGINTIFFFLSFQEFFAFSPSFLVKKIKKKKKKEEGGLRDIPYSIRDSIFFDFPREFVRI